MFRLFECCALSFFERFVLSFSLKIERFVSDSAEIWICGLYSVYAVGYDDNFILVKAYRAFKDSMGISLPRYDKDTTEYYIIPVNNTQKAWEAQENKFGAFSKKDFEVKRKELGVPDDITFKEL